MGLVQGNVNLTIPFCYARLEDTRKIMLLSRLGSIRRNVGDSTDLEMRAVPVTAMTSGAPVSERINRVANVSQTR